MIRFLVVAVLLVTLVSFAAMLLFTLVATVALALAIAIPFYVLAKPHMERHGIPVRPQNSMDHLKNLYVEGKIDLFEFERRVARLLTIEQ